MKRLIFRIHLFANAICKKGNLLPFIRAGIRTMGAEDSYCGGTPTPRLAMTTMIMTRRRTTMIMTRRKEEDGGDDNKEDEEDDDASSPLAAFLRNHYHCIPTCYMHRSTLKASINLTRLL